ncbi:unnamed protein product [Hydatigera taeniaeformis]|uniref:Hexosyltransferase n=1 Tax=Hydatigena taeniaeformis TaxID=6205 RepID=A0A0R3XBF1_HYDTA|nr:unnamed protein product [Hydatigera taeniaeformis]
MTSRHISLTVEGGEECALKQLTSNLLLLSIILFLIIELQLLASNMDRFLQNDTQPVEVTEGNEYTLDEEDLTPSMQCRWPPPDIKSIMVNKGFNITLCVRSSRHASAHKRVKKYALQDLFALSKFRGSITFEGLSLLPHRFWERVKKPQIYLTYPQDVPMSDIVEAVKGGYRVPEMPNYNFPITILSTPKSICQKEGEKYDLVIVVKSSVLAWDARSSFREYMRHEIMRNKQLKVGVIFSLGLPRRHGKRVFDRDGHTIYLPGPAGNMLDIYDGRAAEVMAIINEEIRKYDDIVLADYEDTYYNLTWKTVTNYRWMSAFCRKEDVKLFMTIDDDHRVNLSMVADFIDRIPVYIRRNSLFGKVAKTDRAYRSPWKKLYLSYREFPWDVMYPYLRGFAHLVGPDIVADVAIATAYTRYNYAPEDVYLGMVAFKLGIPNFNEPTMYGHDDYKIRNKKRNPAMVALTKFFPTT